MGTEKYILEALQKRVIAAVAASSVPTLPVKYVGRNFSKPDSGGWLEVIYIPNNVNNEFWSEGKTHQGILRLVMHWIMDDKGVYSPIELIEEIGSYFEKGLKLTDPDDNVTVTIQDNPNLLNVLEEAPEMLLPLSIRYQFFST